MGKGKKARAKARERPAGQAAFFFGGCEDFCVGYTPLNRCPEIMTAVNKIASLVSSMTIHLMQNTDAGDVRVKNELSRKVDITPWRYGTRQMLISAMVREMLLNGNAYAVPVTRGGLLEEIVPIPSGTAVAVPDGNGYYVRAGDLALAPEDVLHFRFNVDPIQPYSGLGLRVYLRDVAHNLRQAAETERGFMESKWKPSIIIKVDALANAFSGPDGRKKLLDEYISTNQAGEPWLIPANQFAVEQIKPLSLNDLAIADTVKLNRQLVASVTGVPPFVLGVGDFNRDAWNNFIDTVIMPIAQSMEQELTRKLLYSPDMYFRFNPRSLYSYDLQTLATVWGGLSDKGIVSPNEVRDVMGLGPVDGGDERRILENYIPADMIAKQKKLTS